MLPMLASIGIDTQPLILALQAPDTNEPAYLVLLGLVLIAVGWIVAGLWMIHAGEKSWRVRH